MTFLTIPIIGVCERETIDMVQIECESVPLINISRQCLNCERGDTETIKKSFELVKKNSRLEMKQWCKNTNEMHPDKCSLAHYCAQRMLRLP